MEDQDTFIYLHGHGRPAERVHCGELRLPAARRRTGHGARRDPRGGDAAAHRRSWPSRAAGTVIEQYDRYSLLGYLVERGLSEQALWLLGPLFNLEGRFHFSLVEWFTHWHDDVFGDLEFIDAGSDTLANAFAPALLDDTRLGAEVHAIDQHADGVAVHLRDAVGTPGVGGADECILTVPFVLLRHMEIDGLDVEKWFTIRNVYYGRAHKIFMQFSRRWWVEDYAIEHGVTVTDLAIRNVVYTPAGQDPSSGKGVIIASYAWEQDWMAYRMLDESQRIAQALQDLAKIHPEARRDVRVRDLARLGAGPPRRRHRAALPAVRDDVALLRRRHPAGRPRLVRERRLRPARAPLDRGRHRVRGENAYAIDAGMRNALPAR